MSAPEFFGEQVQRVDELLDAYNNNVNHLVEVGDIIEKVDFKPAESLRPLADIIYGPIDSLVRLSIKSSQSGQTYDLAVKR